MIPKPYFKRIDHLGIAVASLEASIPVYEAMAGSPCEHIEEVVEQKVKTAFFTVGESHLELLEPTSPESPIAVFLEKRGPGIHHICVEVTQLDELLALYKSQGVRMIDEKPRSGAHGKRIAFVHPKSTNGVLLELSESPTSSHE